MPNIQKLKAGLVALAVLFGLAWLPAAVASAATTAPLSFNSGDPTSTNYQCGVHVH
jgi:hypothetical protein